MRIVCWCVLLCAAVSGCVFGSEPAVLGSAFAEVFDAFAPLALFHRVYADYLFYGTGLTVPHELAPSCDETSYALALLHLHLITQTSSAVVVTMPRIARLRGDLASFCGSHSQTLAAMSMWETPDIALWTEASDLGVFSSIYRLQGELQASFEVYMDELLNPQDRWDFAVAFSLETLLASAAPETIDRGLQAILYGSEEAVSAPPFVSEDVRVAIEELLRFVDVPLDESMWEDAVRWAQLIYQYAIERL